MSAPRAPRQRTIVVPCDGCYRRRRSTYLARPIRRMVGVYLCRECLRRLWRAIPDALAAIGREATR